MTLAPQFSSLQQLQSTDQPIRSSNLLVTYVPGSVDKAQLEKLFTPFGSIVHAKTIKSKGACLGYGFVKFHSIDAAVRAEQYFSSSGRNTVMIRVQFARPPELHKRSLVTFCGIPCSFTYSQILDLFRGFGPICESNISLSAQGWLGTIRFQTPVQAEAAVNALSRWKVPSSSRPIEIKIADSCNQKDRQNLHNGSTNSFTGFENKQKEKQSPLNDAQHRSQIWHRCSRDRPSAGQQHLHRSNNSHCYDRAKQLTSNVAQESRSPQANSDRRISVSPKPPRSPGSLSTPPSNFHKSSVSVASQNAICKDQMPCRPSNIQQSSSQSLSSSTPPSVNPGLVWSHSKCTPVVNDRDVDIVAKDAIKEASFCENVLKMPCKPIDPIQQCRFVAHKDEPLSLHALFSSLSVQSSRWSSALDQLRS